MIAEIQKLFNKIKPSTVHESGACLFWAIATVMVLQDKEKAIIQAGTCLWPRMTKEQDDKISPTHFGYEWHSENIINTMLMQFQTYLPEIHIWAALPEKNIIIDMSTKYFPEQCKQILGIDWPGKLPPDYLWCNCNDLPDNVCYYPYESACTYAKFVAINYMNQFNEHDL